MATKLSKRKIQECIDRVGPFCNYCGVPITIDNISIDHLYPRYMFQSANEANKIDNLVLSCRTCNSSKGMKTLEEWRLHLGLKRIGIIGLTKENRKAVEEYYGKDLS